MKNVSEEEQWATRDFIDFSFDFFVRICACVRVYVGVGVRMCV